MRNWITEKNILRTIRYILIAGVFLILLLFQINTIITYPFRYDDAYNISVSKNIAKGLGYVTTYHQIIPHNPEVTTGPTMILWGAMFVKIFGNHNYTPGLATAVLIDILLITLLFLPWLHDKRKKISIVAIFVFLYLLYMYDISRVTGLTSVSFLGEIPTSLLSIISILLLQVKNKYRFFLSGAFLSLAILTKLLALILLPGIIVAIIYNSFNSKHIKNSVLKSIKNVFGFILPLLLIVGGFYILRFHQQPIDNEINFVKNTTSGISHLYYAENKYGYIITNVVKNVKILVKFLGGKVSTLSLIILLLVSLVSVYKSKSMSRDKKTVMYAFLMCLFSLYSWWIVFSPAGPVRHSLLGLFLLFFFLSYYVNLGFKRIKKFNIFFLSIFIIISIMFNNHMGDSRDPQFIGRIDDLLVWEMRPRLKSLLETKNYVSELQKNDEDVTLLGCGWWVNRDLEYLLDGSLNFKDCLLIKDDMLSSKDNVYLVRGEKWNWENNEEIENFRQNCEKDIVYENQPFTISRCNQERV